LTIFISNSRCFFIKTIFFYF